MFEQDGNVIFREVQRWGAWLRWLLVVSMLVAVAGGGYAAIVIMREEPVDMTAVLITISCGVVVPIGIMLLFLINRLETEVRSDGVYIRFFPFHLSFKRFGSEDLSECFARQYRPIWEYGGWGIRYSLRAGKAYNMSGNEGVQLVFNNGKRLLIGSKESANLESAIRSIMPNRVVEGDSRFADGFE